MENKSLVRHEILNALTVLSFLLAEQKLPADKKQELDYYLRICITLTQYQDIFMGKLPASESRSISLLDALEIALASKTDCKVTLPKQDITIEVDGYYLEKALRAVMQQHLRHAKQLCLRIVARSLLIKHDATEQDIFAKKPLLTCLKDTQINIDQLDYQLGLEIFKISGVRFEFRAGETEIRF